jgi:DNA-binding response OmpR family regulator
MRILLVEDDPVLAHVMRDSLLEAGHRVDAATTAADAAHLWQVQPFDAVLLDLNLPDGSGITILRQARARGDRTPVVVLTARNRTDERIAGLDAGADDYLGKPFDLGEVQARLRAIGRRAQGADDLVQVGALQLDRLANRFWLQREPRHALELPAREFEVLRELMTPPGRVISKRSLAHKLSDFDDTLADNALEAFVSRLRRKLVGTGATIRTLRGLGYVLEAEGQP